MTDTIIYEGLEEEEGVSYEYLEVDSDGNILALHNQGTISGNVFVRVLESDLTPWNSTWVNGEWVAPEEPSEELPTAAPTPESTKRFQASEAITARYPLFKQLNTYYDFGYESLEVEEMMAWIKSIRDWSNDVDSTDEDLEALVN